MKNTSIKTIAFLAKKEIAIDMIIPQICLCEFNNKNLGLMFISKDNV